MRLVLRPIGSVWFALLALATLSRPQPVAAQSPDSESAAFSIASSHIASTRERPAVFVTFRRISHLDFRVYRIDDTSKFFLGLRDLHQLGSPEPTVPQERSWIERIALWKADRRDAIRQFIRFQFSHEYRVKRREQRESQQVALRRTVRFTTFAQVPLLNPAQLVSSWRELLPPVREAESRRIPLELPSPGAYLVEAVNAPLKAYTVVIVSDIGLVAKSSPGQLLLFAANRFTGEPVPECDVQVIANRKPIAKGRTAQDGIYELTLEGPVNEDVVALARCGTQTIVTDPGSWYMREPSRELVGYVYTDKPIYRPGHVIRLKAILRWRQRGTLWPFDRKQVELVVADGSDKVLLRQTRSVDEFGSVTGSLPLPDAAALGYYTIRISSESQQATGSFEVQEYRKPEFDVVVRPAERFVVQGGRARATIGARYYFGQPVAGATVKYVVHRQPYSSPLRWQDPDEAEVEGGGYGGGWYGGEQISEITAVLANDGTREVTVPVPVDDRGQDYSMRVEARITDASGREVSDSTMVHATYARFLIAARPERYVYQRGANATLGLRALDYTGAPQAGVKINVWLERIVRQEQYEAPSDAETVSQSVIETDASGRASWKLTLPSSSGSYRFQASTRAGDRLVRDSTFIWVPGASDTMTSGDEYLELVADKKTYQPGDTARLLIKSGRFEAPVLVTKESQTVSWHAVTRTRANDAIEVPVTADDLGDTYVNVVFLKDDRLYRAEKRIAVPAVSRELEVVVVPDKPVARPRQPATFTVRVRDRDGRPVRAQLSLGVVDEALYAVKRDDTPDPLRFFYRREYSRVGTQFSREYSFVGYSGTQQLMLTQRRRPFTLADFKSDRPMQPQVRKNFPDAIFWVADLTTGSDGAAKVRLEYPDALTTWRLTARAITTDTSVGSSLSRTTTTKDLIVRVVAPRFLTEGDELAVPAIVHNYLKDAKSVKVSMSAAGLLSRPGADPTDATTPRTTEIASNDEHRMDWQFAAGTPGTATITGTAIADSESDAVEVSLPILPFGLKRRVSIAGSMIDDKERAATLTVPEASNPSARSIEVRLAPSLAGSLLGAVDFLTSFPYGCTEQTLSSFLPNLMVTRTLVDLKLAPTERLRVLDRQVAEGLRRLYDYQHDDGGWGWWKTDENQPFMTAYALYGLLEANTAGYAVDSGRIDNATRALAALYAKYPRAVPDLKAYLVYVLSRAMANPAAADPGRAAAPDAYNERAALDELWSARDRLSPYGQALLLLTLDARKDARGNDLARTLTQSARTEGELSWWRMDSDPLLEDWNDTSVEATAFAVKALVARDGKNPLLERAVRWLLLNRRSGWYWSSTKQTAMVLYGLLDYMRARGESASPFSVDVTVNGQAAGSHTFSAADIASPDPVVIRAAGRAGANEVRLVKRGGGALYWSAIAQYFDTRAPIERTGSRRLALVRRYFSLTPVQKNGRLVYRESPFSGATRTGDLLLVRLSAAGSTDWRYLMLEDPLPAGAEPVQQDEGYEMERPDVKRWYGSRREFHDDRAVFFQDRFDQGRYDYEYLLKVMTPGRFKALPAQISAMYVPEATASSEIQPVIVERADSGAAAARP